MKILPCIDLGDPGNKTVSISLRLRKPKTSLWALRCYCQATVLVAVIKKRAVKGIMIKDLLGKSEGSSLSWASQSPREVDFSLHSLRRYFNITVYIINICYTYQLPGNEVYKILKPFQIQNNLLYEGYTYKSHSVYVLLF